MEGAGFLWLLVATGMVLLAIGIAYGMAHTRRNRGRFEARQEAEAVRRNYREENEEGPN